MKILKKFSLVVFVLLISSINIYSFTIEYGPFTVTSLRLGANGFEIALSPAPQLCAGGGYYGMQLKLDLNYPNETAYKEMAAALLSAYVTGEKIHSIWVDQGGDCSCSNSNPGSVLRLRMFQFYPK